MTNIIKLPVIAGVEITTDAEGRFNLNALHRASGAEKKNGASYWLATDSAKALVDLINSKTTGISVVTVEGRNGGTFAVEQLAVAYANWISPEFYLQVINTFLDSKKGALSTLPQSLPEALRLAATLAEERDEAIRTKAQIGSTREASAMARASAETRRANKLAEMVGDGKNWKAVKSIVWLAEVFAVTKSMYQQVGKKLKAISSEMDIEVKEIEDSAYGTVKAYHVDVINELHGRLLRDGELLAKYRRQAVAA